MSRDMTFWKILNKDRSNGPIISRLMTDKERKLYGAYKMEENANVPINTSEDEEASYAVSGVISTYKHTNK